MNAGDVIGGEAPWEADAWIRRPWIRGEVECISGGKLAHDLNKPFFRMLVKCRRYSRCITVPASLPNKPNNSHEGLYLYFRFRGEI